MLADHLARIGVLRLCPTWLRGLDSCTRWLTGSSLWRYPVLVFAHIHLHRRKQPPNEWLRECCFHFPSVCEVNVLNGLAGFLIVDLLSHHIFPLGCGGVDMCAERGSTSSSSTSSRFCCTPYVFWLAGSFVFLKYLFKDARKYTNALTSFGRSREDGHGDGGLAACYTSHFPFFCPCIVSGPWSCRPQPLGSGGDATPCEDPRQEHGLQFKFVARCLSTAAAHDVKDRRVPGAASERTPLSSATLAPDVVG